MTTKPDNKVRLVATLHSAVAMLGDFSPGVAMAIQRSIEAAVEVAMTEMDEKQLELADAMLCEARGQEWLQDRVEAAEREAGWDGTP